MSENEIVDATGTQRRGFLKCMLWAGTGVLWTVSGGVPRSALLGGTAMAADTYAERAELRADQRQPYRFRQPAEHGHARHAARGDRSGERSSRATLRC